MRNVVLLTALAAATVSPLDAAAWLEETPPQDIQLETLLHQPDPYLNLRVHFRAVFVENGDLYDPIHTQYSPETYINIVVWDERARIWDPQVRAKPFASLYLAKDRINKTALRSLKKYDVVDITGEVASGFRKQPWVTIQQISLVEGEGRFSDNSIYHLEQATAMANDGARDLAETQFAAAMADHLPLSNGIIVADLRARNLAASGHDAEAAKLLERAGKQAHPEEGDSPVSTKDRADVEYMLAKVKDDLAAGEGDSARKELYEQAAKHARTAIDLDPALSDAYSALGIALAGLGEFDEARKQCAIAIRMQPNNAETRLYLGQILDKQGQPDEAIDALKKAIDLTPKDARMHAAIASAYEHRGAKGGAGGGNDMTTALREYDIAIRLKPNDADLINASGRVIEQAAASGAEVQIGTQKQKATQEMAVERYKAAITANPNHLATHLALAKAYQAAGNNEEAAKHLQAAVDIDPKDPKRLVEVAKFLEGLDGKKPDALAMWERAASASPHDADIRYHVGHLALELGSTDKAQAALEKAVEMKPKHFAALADLVDLHLAAGDPKKAKKRLEEAEAAARTPEEKERARTLKAKVEQAGKR